MDVAFDFSAWQVWLAAGLALAIAEVLGTQFVLLALGVACALTALVTALTGIAFNGQVLAFAVFAALLVPAFIVYYRRHMMPVATRTLISDGLGIGETFTVVRRGERIGIRIQGDFFPVEGEAGLDEGDKVIVSEWRGISAIVRRAA